MARHPLTIGIFSTPRSPPWLVAKDARVFLHCAIRDPGLAAHGMPVVAGVEGRDQLIPIATAHSRHALPAEAVE
jgi:hypothetical protein